MPPSAAPGPTGAAAIRCWVRMAQDPLRTYADLQRSYGDAVRVPFRRHRPLLLLSRPEHAEHVLVAQQHNYVKSVTYRPLRAFLGSGLLTSEGELWERHRGIVQPVFARRHLDALASGIVPTVRCRTAAWGGNAGIVDVAAEMRALTLDIVGRLLFGASLADSAGAIGIALGRVQRGTTAGIMLTSVAPERANWSWLRRLPGVSAAVACLDQIVTEIVSARRAEPTPPAARDLLDLLLMARDQVGSGLADAEIRDEVLTLMLAGHETTSAVLTWTLALLSRFPAARDRVEAEVDGLAKGRLGPDGVDRLPFTAAVVSESMRLYPPAWTIERDAVGPDVIAGVRVGVGTTVVVSPYLLHRHPDLWPDPERFDPERFLGENGRPRYAFLPFGGGRRICVGAGLAMLEATLVLAGISQSHRLELTADAMPRGRAEVTYRPRGPVPMRCTPRPGALAIGP